MYHDASTGCRLTIYAHHHATIESSMHVCPTGTVQLTHKLLLHNYGRMLSLLLHDFNCKAFQPGCYIQKSKALRQKPKVTKLNSWCNRMMNCKAEKMHAIIKTNRFSKCCKMWWSTRMNHTIRGHVK